MRILEIMNQKNWENKSIRDVKNKTQYISFHCNVNGLKPLLKVK